MPCSKKQLAANRRNARKCTGPKTPQGKAVSSRNALKHGIFSAQLIIESPHAYESPEHYEKIRQLFMKELGPITFFQEFLAAKIVSDIWLSLRVVRAESALLRKLPPPYKTPAPPPPSANPRPLDRDSLIRACLAGLLADPTDTYAHNLLRYEHEIDRRITHIYRILRRRQLIDTYELSRKKA